MALYQGYFYAITMRCQNRFAVPWGRWWLRWGGNETDMI